MLLLSDFSQSVDEYEHYCAFITGKGQEVPAGAFMAVLWSGRWDVNLTEVTRSPYSWRLTLTGLNYEFLSSW